MQPSKSNKLMPSIVLILFCSRQRQSGGIDSEARRNDNHAIKVRV
jgi:hypothetical protein